MRLKPALIMLGVFAVVIGALAVFVATYQGPSTDETLTADEEVLFQGLVPGQVTQIEIVSPKAGGPVVLRRTGERKWRMVRPFDALASWQKVAEILDGLARLKSSQGYATENFVDYELDEPAFRVVVTTSDGTTHSAAFGTRFDFAEAASEARMDAYTLAETGGEGQVVPHRYTRVGTRNQVLIVRDTICPKLDVDPAALREPALVYAETPTETGPVKASEVRKLAITVRGNDGQRSSTVLQRTPDSQWRVTKPVDARADGEKTALAVSQLVELAAEGDGAYVDDDPKDLAKYGLEQPRVLVEMEPSGEPGGAVRHTVRFGAESSDGRMHAQSSSRKSVMLVPGAVVETALTQGADYFRDRRLLVMRPEDIESVTFRYADGRADLAIERGPDAPGSWRITKPVTGRAAPGAVGTLLDRILCLAVAPGGFVGENENNLGKCGLDTPGIIVSLAGADGSNVSEQVLIGGQSDDDPALVYAKNVAESSVVLVPATAVGDLSPTPESMRSRILLDGFTRWDGVEIEIVAGSRKALLKRGEKFTWTFVEPEGARADYVAPNLFLATVEGLKVKAWPADAPDDYAAFGLDNPAAVLSITTEPDAGTPMGHDEAGARKTFVVQFGTRTDDGKRCYVRVPPEPNVYEIDADILARVEKCGLPFRDRNVLSFNAGAVHSLRVEGGRASYALRWERAGLWRLAEPMVALADDLIVKAAIEAMSQLTTKEFVCEGGLDDTAYGLDEPYRKLTAIVAEPGQGEGGDVLASKTLLVGAAVPDNKDGERYAAVAGDGAVFVIAGDVAEKLAREMASLTVVNIIRPEVSEVSVQRGDGSGMTVVRKSGGWEITSHKDVVADRQKVESLAEEAGWVRAESYVSYDLAHLERYGLDHPTFTMSVTRKGQLPVTFSIGGRARDEDLPPAKKASAEKGEKGRRPVRYYYATGAGIPAVFLLRGDKVAALDKHIEDISERSH